MKIKQLLLGIMLCLSVTGYSLFTDNYSATTGWTPVGGNVSVTGGFATYNVCTDGMGRRIYKSHGQTLTNSWRYDCFFRYSAVGTQGPGHFVAVLTAGTLDPTSGDAPSYTATNQDAIGMNFMSLTGSGSPSAFQIYGGSKDANNTWVWSSSGVLLVANTDYYLTLERLDQTNGRVSVFSNADRTTLIGSVCFTISANVQADLPVLQHANNSWGTTNRSLTGVVDNSWLDNITTTVGVTSGSQTICTFSGDPAPFIQTTAPTTGFVGGITGYQWQSSPDFATWTDIPGATDPSYDETAGLAATMYYRRIVYIGCGVALLNKVITLTVTPCNTMSCAFSDNFSSATPWTQIGTGISVTGTVAQYSSCADAVSRRIYRTHGVTLTNSWRLDFDFNYTAVGSSGPGHHLASVTAGTLDPVSGPTPFPATNQDVIAASFLSTNATNVPSTFQLFGGSKNDANAWNYSATGILLTMGTQYYISLERLDLTHGRICVYTDAARTVHAANSPQCFVIDPNVATNLPVIQHGNTCWGSELRSLTGAIDNDCLSNLVFGGGTISASQIVDCGSIPATLSNVTSGIVPTSAYSISYQWQRSYGCTGTWTNISGTNAATYTPPAVTQTTCYRRVMLVTGCNAGQFPSNTVTITANPIGTLDANFSVTASAPTGSPTFTVSATAVTNGSIWFFWEVSEIDLTTGLVVPGTTVTNLPAWHAPSQIPTTTFPGYVFQTDHKYGITRMVADTCYDTSTVYWTIFHGTGLMPNDNLYFVTERTDDMPQQGTSTGTAGTQTLTAAPASFKAFPNPSEGTFVIRYDLRSAEKGQITITDVHGNKIADHPLSNSADNSLIQIQDLSSGIYFIQFTVNGQLVQTEKVVVVK